MTTHPEFSWFPMLVRHNGDTRLAGTEIEGVLDNGLEIRFTQLGGNDVQDYSYKNYAPTDYSGAALSVELDPTVNRLYVFSPPAVQEAPLAQASVWPG